MAAQPNKRRVPTHEYQVAMREIADAWGWRTKDVWFWFQQLAWLREFEQRWPREVAEYAAHADIIAILDKRGQAPS